MRVTSEGLPSPRLEIDVEAIRHNARVVSGWCRDAGLGVYAVTKGVRGDPLIARALLGGGVTGLADSRLSSFRQLQDLRQSGGGGRAPGPRFLLLRAPSPGQATEAVSLADEVLCASADVAEAVGRAAAGLQPGRAYGVILTVDLGDLREGLLPEDVPRAAIAIEERLARASGGRDPERRAFVAGLATNLACLCGVVPTRGHLETLVDLARQTGQALGRRLSVSGGNTAVLPLLLREGLPPGIDDLRVGEGILLGRESLHREPLPGLRVDPFTLWGPVIEIARKPTCPVGECAEDAFGHRPVFVDRGRRLRAIVAAGRQDLVPEGLRPLTGGLEVVGATSDHLVIDVEDYPGTLRVGDEVGFRVNYACLLQAMTSPDVARVHVGQA